MKSIPYAVATVGGKVDGSKRIVTAKPHRRAGGQRRVVGRDGHQRRQYDFAALVKAMG